MGLLAPLYIAGLLAIALPIVFHLIRRTPSGRQAFGSLMFLTPSPPRLTRRSRLSNLLLLLLRAAALALLAFAFARPFFNRGAEQDVTQSRGRRVALLVDTSASMRRGDLWRQATQQAEQVVGGLSPNDEVALLLFDRQVRPAMTFAEWNELDPARRAAVLRARLAEAGPTWAGTKLGDALATAADLLAEQDEVAGRRKDDKAARQLVLISDLQQGGHAEALQGHQWPEGVLLEVRPVGVKQTTNAAVQFVKQAVNDDADKGDRTEKAEKADARLRVRVGNQPGSGREQFSLAWADERGPLAGVEPLKVYVPPGRNQTVRVPWPPQGKQADRLVLQGDEFDFDNTLYVVPPRQDAVRVVYVGDDAEDDVKGLRYYLQSALGDTPQRKLELAARRPGEPLAEADLLGARLAVVASALPDDRAAALRRFLEGGGDVLWVLKDAAAAQGLARMTGVENLPVEEASAGDYALIGRVDFEHPLFAPFKDTRFADFTKIHFWKHRRVKLADPAAARVLARFDNGDPFLFERPVGRGRVLVMTSGWHPADSQLALSTKFVPLMEGLLRRPDAAVAEAQYAVGDPIALPAAAAGQGNRTLFGPDGRKTEVAAGAAATPPEATDRPGVYRLNLDGRETPVAVNLPADESRTALLAVEELERWGAKVGTPPSADELVARQRQLRVFELENRQKAWRWVILTVLALLAVETALAGRLTRRAVTQQQQVTT